MAPLLSPASSRHTIHRRTLARLIQSIKLLRFLPIISRSLHLNRSHLPSLLFLLRAILLPLLVILNIRSLPGIWHWRVLWCVVKVRTRYTSAWMGTTWRYFYRLAYLLAISRIRNMGTVSSDRELDSKGASFNRIQQARLSEMESFLSSVTPIGSHPFEWEGRYDSWVAFDDGDFNLHMSNSSYPKILDFARTKASLELFPHFLRVGGHVALSSTHFHFIREIPLFVKYQIRLSIGAWDEKWCYIISRFVTGNESALPSESSTSILQSNLEGLTLHAVAVSRICFKIGRITIPPSIVFATNGMSVHPWELLAAQSLSYCGLDSWNNLKEGDADTPSRSGSEAPSLGLWYEEEGSSDFASDSKNQKLRKHTLSPKFSHSNPPPSWLHYGRSLIDKTEGGSEGKLKEFYKSGWRKIHGLQNQGSNRNVVSISIPHTRSDSSSSSSTSSSTESDNTSEYSTTSSSFPSSPPSEPNPAIGSDSLKWWEHAMGFGGPADKRRKERLEICRMLVGGMDGVRDLVK